MSAIDDLLERALAGVLKVARGALPTTASALLPVVEKIADSALKAKRGALSIPDADAIVRSLSTGLSEGDARIDGELDAIGRADSVEERDRLIKGGK